MRRLTEVQSSIGRLDVSRSDNEVTKVLAVVALGGPLLDHRSQDSENLGFGDGFCRRGSEGGEVGENDGQRRVDKEPEAAEEGKKGASGKEGAEEKKQDDAHPCTSSTASVRGTLLRASSCRFREPFRRRQSLLARVGRILRTERRIEPKEDQPLELLPEGRRTKQERGRDPPFGHPVILMTIESFLNPFSSMISSTLSTSTGR